MGMGMVMSAIVKLINLYIIVFALSLQGSKGLTKSPSPIQVTLGPSSNGKPFTSDPPSSVPRPIGSFSPPELAAPPSVAEASPPSDSDPPISMPVDQAPPFVAPTVPPTGSRGKEPVIETPSSMPVAPVATPPMISPPVQPNSPATSPPTEPITPVSIATPPRELGKSPPAPVVISPSQPRKPSPFIIDPTSPGVSPSMLPDHTISPMSSPPTISNWKNEAVPVAAPSNQKPKPSSQPVSQIPTQNGSNIAPAPSNLLPKSHTDGNPPALSPSKSFEKPYKPRNRTTNLAPAPSHPLSPPTSKEHGPAVPAAPFRAHRHSHHYGPPPGPPPLKPDSPISPSRVPFSPPANHVSPTPAPSQKASSVHNRIFPSKPPSESPKAPLLPQLQAFPPPPPNEDCSTIICTEPYTNTPPGSRCGCVLPIQVGLRLSVSLYTFFPLVSELAGEIAAGVSVKQSQVRIIGANAANQEPDKTVILVDLVPLGESFDNATAFSTYRRFWNKQVAIQTNYFGDYEVLYVRYPGLPESPPSGAGVTDDGLYPGSNDNNGRKVKPLGVDLPKSQHKNGPSVGVIAVIVLSASLTVIFCAVAAWIFLFKHRDGGSQPRPKNAHVLLPTLSKASGGPGSVLGNRDSSATLSFCSSIATYTGSAKTFSAGEIEKATDHFDSSRVIGEGGFGRVYSGVFEDGTKVAIKVLKRDDQQGGREFLAEVEMLGRLHHRNLVKLIGICTEDRARCLVYELIPNGSVESHLHGIDKERAPLNWGARIKIALGAARGLSYLHEDSSPRVIHRDFKSSNILLEDDFTPKVSDFGLARTALDEENRHISTRVMGTFGYVAPEYAMTGHLLVKSDVYSYGVVLLELLTGRKPVDMSQPPGEENLVAWARPLLTSREGLETIVDRSLGGPTPFDSVAKVAAIASMCVQPEVSNRPFMGEVVQALKLVRNEIDEPPSGDDLSLDTGSSGRITGPVLQSQCSAGSYGSSDIGAYELFGGGAASAGVVVGPVGEEESESFRRRSSSGPLGSSRTERVRRSSSSSSSVAFRLWLGSH